LTVGVGVLPCKRIDQVIEDGSLKSKHPGEGAGLPAGFICGNRKILFVGGGLSVTEVFTPSLILE
jgi:hypothetical protein